MAINANTNLTFASIVGHWVVHEDQITYLAPQLEVGVPVGICIASCRLVEGSVTVKVKGGDSREHGRILLGY
jgi:hypothetical protein